MNILKEQKINLYRKVVVWARLLILLLLGVGSIVITSHFFQDRSLDESVTKPSILKPIQNEVLNPEYHSLSVGKVPYVIKAKKAVTNAEKETHLVAPYTIYYEPDGDAFGKAKQGFYDSEKKILYLRDQVHLWKPGFYVMKAPEATINTHTHTVSGTKGIWGDSTWGKWKAEIFHIQRIPGCEFVQLRGQCQLTIMQRASH